MFKIETVGMGVMFHDRRIKKINIVTIQIKTKLKKNKLGT